MRALSLSLSAVPVGRGAGAAFKTTRPLQARKPRRHLGVQSR